MGEGGEVMDAYKATVDAIRAIPNDGTLDLVHDLVKGLDGVDPTRVAIVEECVRIATMLLAKNAAYGDSALSPLRVFSKASSIEQILVRIDDKLSRLARGTASGEDVELDLVGYLVLLRIARKREAACAMEPMIRVGA